MIVTRHMDGPQFQEAAFRILAREIVETFQAAGKNATRAATKAAALASPWP